VPGTVWGTASNLTAKFMIGAVLAPQYRQALDPRSSATSAPFAAAIRPGIASATDRVHRHNVRHTIKSNLRRISADSRRHRQVFIVLSVIAWTYLLHWHFGKNGVDYRYWKDGSVLKTKHGAAKHWELEACLDCPQYPLDDPTRENLRFLIAIRHEIEHQMTRLIDDTISAKLQACCLNFNRAIKTLAGPRHGLDGELAFALQFSRISQEQRNALLSEMDLPAHIVAAQTAFEETLTDEMIRDPRYAYRVALVEVAANSRGKANRVIEFVKPGAGQQQEIERVLFKYAEKPKYKPGQIVSKM
jgi:Protein of unknown function (DUF3644)